MTERTFILTAETWQQRMDAARAVVAEIVKRGNWDLILRERKAKRSRDQNRRYWALLNEVADTAWTPNDDGELVQQPAKWWHCWFRVEFIGIEETRLPGRVLCEPISTTTLSVAEFTDYMQRIEQWCADQGYPLGMAA